MRAGLTHDRYAAENGEENATVSASPFDELPLSVEKPQSDMLAERVEIIA